MSNHHLTAATTILLGGAAFEPHKSLYDGRRGYVATPPSFKSFGAAAAIVAGALMSAATGAEVPNTNTITYTTADSGASPIDSASVPAINAAFRDIHGNTASVWTLDVPRNVTLAVTHATAVVAMSVLVSGYDEYGQPMTETLAVTATGTSKSAAGKKAFKSILSYALTAAGNATANTVNIAWGNVFGLPYRVTDAAQVLPFGNAVPDITGTVAVADDTTATSTTGDPRGTYAPSSAADGTKKYAAWIVPADPSVAQPKGLFGNVPA